MTTAIVKISKKKKKLKYSENQIKSKIIQKANKYNEFQSKNNFILRFY